MKIGFFDPRQDIALVGAIREAIGPDVRLAVEANHAYNAYTAVEVGRGIARHDISWFEEPCLPEDIQGYLEVKARIPIPISLLPGAAARVRSQPEPSPGRALHGSDRAGGQPGADSPRARSGNLDR